MGCLFLDATTVQELLPIEECMDVMATALSSLTEGVSHMPQRTVMRPPALAGVLGLMPAYIGGTRPILGLKAICVFPTNKLHGKDAHQGVVLLFDPSTGEAQAVVEASAITAIRTAAVSALATRLLARSDAAVLALVGAGTQARAHLETIDRVRRLSRVLVADMIPDRAWDFVHELQACHDFSMEVADSVEAAVREADIVVTATTSSDPVLLGRWIRPGTHVNAVGASTRGERELDADMVARSSFFVDSREAVLDGSGDYLGAVHEGAIDGPNHIRAEIGELLLDQKPGRTATEEITVFENLGLAIEDVAAAAYACDRAREAGRGVWVEL